LDKNIIMYDILITVAEKDFNKLRYLHKSIVENLQGYKNIYIVSPIDIPNAFKVSDCIYYLDKDIIDVDLSAFKGVNVNRKGWYKQQFIKLFQNITTDQYLVVDSDVCFNRPINIYKNDKPCFLFGKNQYHPAYFQFIKRMFDLDKQHPYSFINEVMFFDRKIIKQMINSTKLSIDSWYKRAIFILNEINDASGFSEFETYGNYVTKYYPKMYNYLYLKTNSKAKKMVWTDKDIEQYIANCKSLDLDFITLHTWL